MSKAVFFLSDAHLGAEEEDKEKLKEEKLIFLLDRVKEEGEFLYLVGDMFEFWFEYKSVIPKDHFKVLTKLKQLVDCGIKINYLVGNHDFWLGDFLPKHIGIPIFKQSIDVVHQGKRIFISHGDGLAKMDLGYRILKRILRNRINIFLYRQIPPGISYPLAKFVAQRSRSQVQKRDKSYLEDYKNFAAEKIKQGFDAVILAHTHVPILCDLSGGIYLNSGDLFCHFTYGRLWEGKFYLESYA
ncbi:MAG: UDP-2,3-diacylglucosamine diphosphatase [candidate division Zixibacteria bacterium]|nr:UDP-2,3-diacylglucosamine diphosphatase [candidate division Zixibacteria bacterium]